MALGRGAMIVVIHATEQDSVQASLDTLRGSNLHGPVSASEMAQIVARHRDLNAAARELVSTANQKDGSDNISVQLIRIRSVERMGMYRGRPYKLR